jgi:hypothetical protein
MTYRSGRFFLSYEAVIGVYGGFANREWQHVTVPNRPATLAQGRGLESYLEALG